MNTGGNGLLVISDLHLTADPADDYRWGFLETLYDLARDDKQILILGDITDRRDRHPADLVNRLVNALRFLTEDVGAEVTILQGNHDRPVYSAVHAYWAFLNELDKVRFVTRQESMGDAILLPYHDKPEEAWKDIPFWPYRAAFAHIPMRQLDQLASLLPRMPPKIYSGDEHPPKTVGKVTYVGAPHPVKYGDDYRCRILQLGAYYAIDRDITLHPPGRRMIDINTAADLANVAVNSGDSAKVRLHLELDQAGDWSTEQAKIAAWALEHGVALTSVEPMIAIPTLNSAIPEVGDPESVLTAYLDAMNMQISARAVGRGLLDAYNQDR
jgi:calcineurin-like phosphoesterase family protein